MTDKEILDEMNGHYGFKEWLKAVIVIHELFPGSDVCGIRNEGLAQYRVQTLNGHWFLVDVPNKKVVAQ